MNVLSVCCTLYTFKFDSVKKKDPTNNVLIICKIVVVPFHTGVLFSSVWCKCSCSRHRILGYCKCSPKIQRCAFVVKFNSTVVGHELRRSLKYTIVKEDSSFNQVVRLLSSPVRSNKYTVFNK